MIFTNNDYYQIINSLIHNKCISSYLSWLKLTNNDH